MRSNLNEIISSSFASYTFVPRIERVRDEHEEYRRLTILKLSHSSVQKQNVNLNRPYLCLYARKFKNSRKCAPLYRATHYCELHFYLRYNKLNTAKNLLKLSTYILEIHSNGNNQFIIHTKISLELPAFRPRLRYLHRCP